MSTQALFDKIVNHLVTQGEPAGRYSPYLCDFDFDCLYRSVGSNGQTTMCAVGCLISDEVYAKHFDPLGMNKLEGVSAANAMIKRALVDSNPGTSFTPKDLALLASCQTAHDSAARESGRPDNTIDKDLFMRNLAKRMSHVAGLYRLVVPEALHKAAGQALVDG